VSNAARATRRRAGYRVLAKGTRLVSDVQIGGGTAESGHDRSYTGTIQSAL
jgi:hypothetical protein